MELNLDQLYAQTPIYEPAFWTKNSWIQIAYGVWVNQAQVLIGLAFGFSAVTFPQVNISMVEKAWFASALPLMAPVGCMLSGYLLDTVGRSMTLVLCMIPMALGWFNTGFGYKNLDLILGRIFTGVGVGMAASAPWVYCAEIATPNMRGVLSSFPIIALAVGVTIQALMGSFMPWYRICHVCGIYCLALMVVNCFLPETPYYVLMNGTIIQTRKALARFRAHDYDTEDEIEELREFKINNHLHKLSFMQKLGIIFASSTCKPYSIIVVYLVIGQLSGVTVTMFYTIDILVHAHVSLNPFYGNIILGVVRLLSSVMMGFMVFTYRRRPIALISSAALGLACFATSYTSENLHEPAVYPLFFFITYVIAATFGYHVLPFMMLFEVVPLEVRGTLGALAISLVYILIFATNKGYPYLVHAIGFADTMIAFGIFSCIGFVFLLIFLPETKGLSLADIEEYYRGNRPELSRLANRPRNRMKAHEYIHRASVLIKKAEESEGVRRIEEEKRPPKEKKTTKQKDAYKIRFKIPEKSETEIEPTTNSPKTSKSDPESGPGPGPSGNR